jgi:molybdopterin/thiamine biosynthesis adenylyltransferase
MLNDTQKSRYERHLMLPEIGERGQERLLAGSILVIGAGGLGSPALHYLTAAGVGRIGIVDNDRVEISNLQRQILHHTPDIGTPKVVSAAAKLSRLNPDARLVTHEIRGDAATMAGLVADYDFVIDATDNFTSKFLINDTCVRLNKPFSHGGILRFSGQTMTILPGQSPCYRCLFPDEPDEATAIACSKNGLLGVLPGIIGTIQAAEALKYLLGLGELLTGRLLTFDLKKMSFREVAIRKNPGCPLCEDI